MSGKRSVNEAGAEMGTVTVCSARSGCFTCGMVWEDGGGSAGHARVGQGRLTAELRFTLTAAGHRGHRAAPSSSASMERLITARVDGDEDGFSTLVAAKEAE